MTTNRERSTRPVLVADAGIANALLQLLSDQLTLRPYWRHAIDKCLSIRRRTIDG